MLSALACLANTPAQADSLRLTETRSDKLKCRYDRDLEEKTCAVTTTGKYVVTLKISAATLAANEIDLATLLQDADAEQTLAVSLGIGAYQFDGDVYVDSDYQLTTSEVKAEWVTNEEKCTDVDCSTTKMVRTGKLKFSGTPDAGVMFRLRGISLNDENNGYGESLVADVCTASGTVEDQEVVSVMLGDSVFIDLPVTLKCQVRTITKHKGDEEFELIRQRVTAKLGDAIPQE
jgi:hypothetical protein